MKVLITKILNNPRIKNSIWMMLEKVISIFGLIFVTSFVAKYIGPENFGKLAFAASVFAIIQILAMFGLENIIFHKVSKNRRVGEKLILATKPIRNSIFLITSFIVLIYIYVTMDWLLFIFSVATSVSVYFTLSDVYSIYFNATLQSKINTVCNVIGLTTALVLRYGIAEFQLDIEYLSIPIILTNFIPFIIKRIIYNKIVQEYKLVREASTYKKYSISAGKKLILYSLSVAIFTKTSQLFLGWVSTYELGLYTVIATLGTSFYFVFSALISSFMTDIYNENNMLLSQKKVARLNLIVILIGLFALLMSMLLGEKIIKLLYGADYIVASKYLPLMVLTCLFSGLSTVAEKYLIKFNAYSYLQRKTNILLVFNILVTFLFIKTMGLKGAVYSILITEIVTATLFNYLYKSGCIWDTHKRIFFISTYLNR